MSAMGHSRPSHLVPVLNNVRYASDSDHSRYKSELTLWRRGGVSNDCNPRHARRNLLEQFQPFPANAVIEN